MDSGANNNKERGVANGVDDVETTVVDTVGYQTSPGQGQQKRDVQVIHQSHPSETPTTVAAAVVSAASAAGAAIQASKDALSGK